MKASLRRLFWLRTPNVVIGALGLQTQGAPSVPEPEGSGLHGTNATKAPPLKNIPIQTVSQIV
jgi:hypothetical protein